MRLYVAGGARARDLMGCQSVHYQLCHTNRLINMFLVKLITIKYVRLLVAGGAQTCDLTGCKTAHYQLCHSNRIVNMFREISKVMNRHYLVEFSAYRLGTRPASGSPENRLASISHSWRSTAGTLSLQEKRKWSFKDELFGGIIRICSLVSPVRLQLLLVQMIKVPA